MAIESPRLYECRQRTVTTEKDLTQNRLFTDRERIQASSSLSPKQYQYALDQWNDFYEGDINLKESPFPGFALQFHNPVSNYTLEVRTSSEWPDGDRVYLICLENLAIDGPEISDIVWEDRLRFKTSDIRPYVRELLLGFAKVNP